MRETAINDIERINVAILVLGSIASMAITRDFRCFFSFGVASAIMTINFRFLRKIVEGFFFMSSVRKKALLVKLSLKFFGLIGLVVLVVVWGNINIPFFIIGLSTAFLAVVVNQVIIVFAPEVRRKQDGA